MTPSSLVVAAGLAAAPAADAQFALPQSFTIDDEAIGDQFGVDRIVACEVNGDTMVDLATLTVDGTLTVAIDPGLGEASITAPGTYLDLVAHATNEDDGDLARGLYAVGSEGLQSLAWNPETRALEATDIFDETTAWAGATRLRRGDIDGDGHQDLIGVAADRETLLVAFARPAGFVPATTTEFSGLFGGDEVFDFTAADLDGDGADELVGISTLGITIVESDGATTTHVPLTLSSGEVETIVDQEIGGERVAYLHHPSPGVSLLWVMSGTGGTIDQTLNVSTLDPARLTSGPHDGDDASDLLVSTRGGDTIHVLYQSSQSYSLGGSQTRVIAVDDPPAGTSFMPAAFVDLDNDGDHDVAYAYHDTGYIFAAFNDAIDASGLAPKILEVPTSGTPFQFWATTDSTPAQFSLRFTPNFLLNPDLDWATDIEVIVWDSIFQPTGVYQTQPVPSASLAVPLGLTMASDCHGSLHSHVRADLDALVGLNLLQDFHYVTCRFVKRDAGGTVVRSGPHTSLYAYAIGNLLTPAYMGTLEFTVPGENILGSDPIKSDCSSGGTSVGGTGGTGCIPDYPPGEVPEPPSKPPTPVT
ncbi:MAG: VCBS repeat-containing protein [Planctomycetota bacterium]